LQARTRAAQCVVGSPSATFTLGQSTDNLTPSADDYGWEVTPSADDYGWEVS